MLAVLTVEAGRSTLGAFGIGDEPGGNPARALVLFACLGFGLLGFVDDVLGTGEDRGFKGHLRALATGRVTTGLCKIIGGVAVAFVLASQDDFITGKRLLSDAVLIALAANLGNLLDRAPGRVIKVGLVAWIPIAILAGTGAVGVAVAPVMGAFAGLLGDDLRERLMIGDTGANVHRRGARPRVRARGRARRAQRHPRRARRAERRRGVRLVQPRHRTRPRTPRASITPAAASEPRADERSPLAAGR